MHEEFVSLLRSYLEDHPDGKQELADELRVAVGTLKRWANGHSQPAKRVMQAVIKVLKSKTQAG
jgi:hypothetical protein